MAQSGLKSRLTLEDVLAEMGIQGLSLQTLLTAEPKNEVQTMALFVSFLNLLHKDHGTTVNTVRGKARDFFKPKGQNKDHGFSREPVVKITTLQETIKFVDLTKDQLGNSILIMTIDPGKVRSLVNQMPDGVVNLSFGLDQFQTKFILYDERSQEQAPLPTIRQVGDQVSYYDAQGKSISEEEYNQLLHPPKQRVKLPVEGRDLIIIDSYNDPDDVYNSLSAMIDLAASYPKKTFVIAGGNPIYIPGKGLVYPDLRKARKRLKSQGRWPDNLIIVGVQWPEIYNDPLYSEGCDIYVKSQDLDFLTLEMLVVLLPDYLRIYQAVM